MNQGRCAEALDVISFVYDWFTEGFETGDLKEAQSLLADLQRHLEASEPMSYARA